MEHRSLAGIGLAVTAAAFALASTGCPTVIETTGGSAGTSTNVGGSGATGGSSGTGGSGNGPPIIVEKVDLLLAIDNSRSMSDKQQILTIAVPDLVNSLVNPPCRDAAGTAVPLPDGFGPLDACPDGSSREFNPVLDIHVGIVSSSLGGHGSDACATSGAGKESNNDKGHLLARLDPKAAGEVETYQGLKFLAWDPAQTLSPPGEADTAADTAADANTTALLPSIRDMVLGVGQVGCGYESQLESWYRFLVDPSPPEAVVLDASGKVVLEGVDEVLLEQRRTFLRPDSALVVVMLTDEDDCSIRESGQFYFAAQQKTGNGSAFHLPKARAVCDTDPGNECCFSCGQVGPKDDDGNPICDGDPTCTDAAGKTIYLDEIGDSINLRCHEQKRRFGIDFLQPIERYVDALKSQTVIDRNGQVVPNPIFTDLDPSDSSSVVRDASLVFFAGIVGVPWQDIARTNPAGVPDLKAGQDPQGNLVGGFKSAAEMSAQLPGKTYSTWDLVLGDFAGYGMPLDPQMIPSPDARSGSNPITGDPLVPSSNPLGNKINGHEYSIPKNDDLQYACIFPIVEVNADGSVSPAVRDCTIPQDACDCMNPSNDNPLCQVNPATGQPTDQVRAKAYPGRRHLAVLKGLGAQGMVASVCPGQLLDPAATDFGYRPAMASIVERLKPHFK